MMSYHKSAVGRSEVMTCKHPSITRCGITGRSTYHRSSNRHGGTQGNFTQSRDIKRKKKRTNKVTLKLNSRQTAKYTIELLTVYGSCSTCQSIYIPVNPVPRLTQLCPTAQTYLEGEETRFFFSVAVPLIGLIQPPACDLRRSNKTDELNSLLSLSSYQHVPCKHMNLLVPCAASPSLSLSSAVHGVARG